MSAEETAQKKSLKIVCQCTCVVSQEVSQNLEGWQSLIKMQKKMKLHLSLPIF